MTRERNLRRLAELNARLNDQSIASLVVTTEGLVANPLNCRPTPLKAALRTRSDHQRHPRFFVATSAGTILNISAAGARLLQRPPSDLVGANWIDLVDAHDQRHLGERWLVASQTHSDFCFTAHVPGALAAVFVRLTACVEADGVKVAYVGTMHPMAAHLVAPAVLATEASA